MRILFDQGTPRPLRNFLPDHTVDIPAPKGWAALSNGELLDMVEQEGFEVLITTDQSMRCQQNLDDRRLAVIVLRSGSRPYDPSTIEEIRSAVVTAQPGEFQEIQI